MKSNAALSLTVIVCAILLLAIPGSAIEHKYIEDFHTTRFKDAIHTTADWDTLAGELKVHPFMPAVVGSCDTPVKAWSVAVSGNHAFVADDFSGLQVIDISDAANPALVGSYNTPGETYRLTVEGDYAYVADGSSLRVIDITDPANPTLAGLYYTPSQALEVAVSGDHAYVACYISGLLVIDISDPSNPTLAGTFDTPGTGEGVEVSGNHAFIADGSYGLQVIDVTDPSTPSLVGTCDTPGYARDLAIEGDNIFVADFSSGFQVIDISDPTNPALVGTCATSGYAAGLTISGNRAFVAAGFAGLQVIDISDPANPVLMQTCDTPVCALGVAVSGVHAFVADDASGLQVIEIGRPTQPTIAGNSLWMGNATDFAVAGDYAIVTDDEFMHGLAIIDISDPAVPVWEVPCLVPGHATGIAVSGNYAFVAALDSGLQVVDIANPLIPTVIGSCSTPGEARRIAVSGDYAYVADGSSGLQVIDISDPAIPVIVGSSAITGFARDVAVSGDHAFVAAHGSGLQVIDISDPASPAVVGTCATPDAATDIVVSGDYAFVACAAAGVLVIDISDPVSPMIAGQWATHGTAYGVAVAGDYAFLEDSDIGFLMLDISDPTNCVLVGACSVPVIISTVSVAGEHVFAAGGTYGLAGFITVQVFQSEVFDPENRIGWSLAVDSERNKIFKARLATTQENNVTWELSADGGTSWQVFTPNGAWSNLTAPGDDLLWRSTHWWMPAGGGNPTVTHLEIEWRAEKAYIDSIVDKPADQGGWARVHFTRSGRDFADETTLPITNYGIWRRVDDAPLIDALEAQASPKAAIKATAGMPDLSCMPVVQFGDRLYIQSSSRLAAASFPPGTWEWLTGVSAVQQDAYIAAVPTAADSSASGPHYSVFVLTAHTTTPSVWYMSEPDSGCSVDNIAPEAPTGFAVAYNTGGGSELSWDPSPAEDLHCFNIYRSSDPTFVPSPSDLVHSTIETNWIDPDYEWGVYYKITALDYVGNESDPASPGTVTAAPDPVIPQAYGLYPNVPNPFNPSTTIRYDVPAGGGAVTLRIYDVSGQLVRTLVDGPQTAGQKQIAWNGTDDRGHSMVSGVYFYRLQAPGYKKTLKMILIQ